MFRIPIEDGKIQKALNSLFMALLDVDGVEMLLLPQVISRSNALQHTLVREKRMIDRADPLIPFMPVNSAIIVSRLTKGWNGGDIIAVMRPCELRAFVELVKLNQGSFDRLIVFGLDCPGTFDIDGFRLFQRTYGENPVGFYKKMASGENTERDCPSMRPCCKRCIKFTPDGADIGLILFGSNPDDGLFIQSGSEKGSDILNKLGLQKVSVPLERDGVISMITQERQAWRKNFLSQTLEGLFGMENLLQELSFCINCHNCMEVCPLCYCRQCVFDSQTMEYEPIQYLRWAERKGAIKMPTDTLFFHLTRMAHMSLSCVGCGQCSMACPMGIRVADIFSTVASRTQGIFNYEPGRDRKEAIPISTFKEKELEE